MFSRFSRGRPTGSPIVFCVLLLIAAVHAVQANPFAQRAATALTEQVMNSLKPQIANMAANAPVPQAMKTELEEKLTDAARRIVQQNVQGAMGGRLPNPQQLAQQVLGELRAIAADLINAAAGGVAATSGAAHHQIEQASPFQTAPELQHLQRRAEDDSRRIVVTRVPTPAPLREYQNFSDGERVGTWLLNTLTPGLSLGSHAVMRDHGGGLAQLGILYGGLVVTGTIGIAIANHVTTNHDVWIVSGILVPPVLGWQVYNIYRSATYDKPVTRISYRRTVVIYYEPKAGTAVGYRLAYNYSWMDAVPNPQYYYDGGGSGVEFGMALSNAFARYWSFRYGGSLVFRSPVNNEYFRVREFAVAAPALVRVGGNHPEFHVFAETGFQLDAAFANGMRGRNLLDIGYVVGGGFYIGRRIEISNRFIFGMNDYVFNQNANLFQYSLGLTFFPGGR